MPGLSVPVACGESSVEIMRNWKNLITRQRIDAVAGAVQLLCLMVVVAVELLFFLPGEAADEIVYLFLEWRLVDVSILFLAASFCRKTLRDSRGYFLLALAVLVWFYVLRAVHLRLEGTNQNPGAFVCAYLLCLPFAAAADDADRQWGLRALAAVFLLTGATFAVFAGLLVAGRLPAGLDGFVFWDGARFGVMGHPNICATILMLGFGFSAAFVTSVKQWWARTFLLLAAVGQFCALSLTNSRATILMTCLLSGGIVFCAVRKAGKKRLIPALLAAAAVTVALFCGSRTLFKVNEAHLIQQTVQSAQTADTEITPASDEPVHLESENRQGDFLSDLKTFNGRTNIWSSALKGLSAYPGILLTGTEYAKNVISPHWGNVLHAHNSWLQMLFQMGIPGLLAALALTVLAVWSGGALLWSNQSLFRSCVALVMLCLMGCAVMEPYLFTVYAQFHYFDFLFMLCLGYVNQWRGQISGRKGETQNV